MDPKLKCYPFFINQPGHVSLGNQFGVSFIRFTDYNSLLEEIRTCQKIHSIKGADF